MKYDLHYWSRRGDELEQDTTIKNVDLFIDAGDTKVFFQPGAFDRPGVESTFTVLRTRKGWRAPSGAPVDIREKAA